VLLILDNYDSFTWNIVQYVGEMGVDPVVHRNDTLTADEAIALSPQAIIISPGPCTPSEAGISVPLVRAAAAAGIPLLGVCLGHQAIGEAFGATVVRADRLMHGKTTDVIHDGLGPFEGLPSPLTVMRYHSLVIAADTVTPELEVCAWSSDRPEGQEIMAVRHRTRPVFGVQFHPESVGTLHGRALLSNFLRSAGYDAAVPAGTSS
jgi:anthranilate synthase/aminodeoxychorismate synthase-like glutamine amidotransferase